MQRILAWIINSIRIKECDIYSGRCLGENNRKHFKICADLDLTHKMCLIKKFRDTVQKFDQI